MYLPLTVYNTVLPIFKIQGRGLAWRKAANEEKR
jgi:hypothetical protein